MPLTSSFRTRGVNIVGVDAIIATSGVAKMTLYRRFRSKDELVLAVLDRREQLWTRGWLQAEVERRADDPDGRLLAIFDVFDGWFRARRLRGVRVHQRADRARPTPTTRSAPRASPTWPASVNSSPGSRPTRGSRPRGASPASWHILMKGSIVSAGEGDVDAALRARQIGTLVLEREPRTA